MFGFKKKKKEVPKEMPSLSEEECTRLQQEIKKLEQKLASCEESEKQAKLFEQIGLDYADLDEIEQAISALENSLAHKESIGDGYKRLMSLYNRKRGEAARKGDDQGIDYYMGKMDDMRQIAKKVTIKGNN
ncbi:tetratricopeptide repeat protein [Enterococcus durans]|uniref:Tetratricopeptide repeat protein n=1 Tax=Enterococcus durans TaxID=53345 RepID=A0A367CI02_9ENTE|nr:tetratricopeptide repeat protein [Enterococcus durans]RCA12207.1 hypothetical protein EA71_00411 [Enterococcus durans]